MSMRQFPKLRPNRWDAVAALAVAVLAVASGAAIWGQGGGAGQTAVVSMEGVETERVALLDGGERTYTHNGYTLRLRLTETEVWVENSDCPTQDCVHTGHISRSGQSIVCLPARISIQLEGGAPNDVDVVIG